MSAMQRSSGASHEKLGRREKILLTHIFFICQKIRIFHLDDLKTYLNLNGHIFPGIAPSADILLDKRELKKFRMALYRLKNRDYLKVCREIDGINLNLTKARSYLYEVTEKGFEAARQAAREVLEKEIVEKAVRRFTLRGVKWATIDEIMEEMWELSKDMGLFASRKEFEEYWTKHKVAIILNNIGLEKTRRRIRGKIFRGYILAVNR
ncbi:hypothetical protein DRO37_04440 [Candidatus Bathyarchaeota archaeon]|nr:MAG: hypothetical protein DRO37_04440 [Candidatus Bathyarchaeota archaeon]